MRQSLVLILCLLMHSSIMGMLSAEKKVKKPRHRKTQKLQQVLNTNGVVPVEMPIIPMEVFMEIFTFIFNMTSLKRTFIHPMMSYMLVSKTWYKYFQSNAFLLRMWRHPRMALLKLRLSHDIEREGNIDLFHACKMLISISMSRNLILKANSPAAFDQLWSIPIFSASRLKKKTYSALLTKAVSEGLLTEPIVPPITKEFETDPRKAIEAHLEKILSNSELVAGDACLTQLLKLIYFDDMYDPDDLSLPHQVINHQVTAAYHSGRIDEVQKVLANIRLVFLPYRKDNMLYICMQYSLFLAAYVGDLQFLKFINLDYEKISTFSDLLTIEERQFLCALQSVQNGDCDVFPVELMPVAKRLLVNQVFDAQLERYKIKVLARSSEILEDPLVDDEIKLMVFENLYQNLQEDN